ncbi:hypothetical protein ACB092_02G218200 [Castanea dentata]
MSFRFVFILFKLKFFLESWNVLDIPFVTQIGSNGSFNLNLKPTTSLHLYPLKTRNFLEIT